MKDSYLPDVYEVHVVDLVVDVDDGGVLDDVPVRESGHDGALEALPLQLGIQLPTQNYSLEFERPI